jgi:hypothetical protein
LKSVFVFILFFFISQIAFNQTIKGRVTDYFSKKPLDAVTVQTNSGHFSISDSVGNYTIEVTKKDSLWFSYLNKQTMKYSVDTIMHPDNFDIALYVDARWLPDVKVATRNYKSDSIINRETYANAFNYRKPGLRLSQSNPSTYSPGGLTAGFDLDEIINSFRFRRNRQMLSFQQRLIQEEHDKYIDHRYTKYLVKKLTGLDGKQLEDFMNYYRPSYDEVLVLNDLELGYYIEQCYKDYKLQKNKKTDN